jgi:hypothetical protein
MKCGFVNCSIKQISFVVVSKSHRFDSFLVLCLKPSFVHENLTDYTGLREYDTFPNQYIADNFARRSFWHRKGLFFNIISHDIYILFAQKLLHRIQET